MKEKIIKFCGFWRIFGCIPVLILMFVIISMSFGAKIDAMLSLLQLLFLALQILATIIVYNLQK